MFYDTQLCMVTLGNEYNAKKIYLGHSLSEGVCSLSGGMSCVTPESSCAREHVPTSSLLGGGLQTAAKRPSHPWKQTPLPK